MNALPLDLAAKYHKARAKDRDPMHWWLTSSKMTLSRGIDVEDGPLHDDTWVVSRLVGTVIAQKWFGYHLYTQFWKGHDMYHNSATPPLA